MKKISSIFLPVLLFAVIATGCDANYEESDDEVFTSKTYSTQYERINVENIAGPFDRPGTVGFLPNGDMLVTEKGGTLHRVGSNGAVTEITGTPEVSARGQGGLLDVVPHYNHEDNGWIYLTFSKPNGSDETATAVVRGRIDENNAFVDIEEIFEQNIYSSPGRHYGSRMAWTNDGKLLVSIGDRGSDPPRAQTTDDHAGTLLRLNDDGTVPDDNPFINNPDYANEIYSYGHRNIQGLIVDPQSGDIWSTEHGPRGGDELNKHEAGSNYGWPTVTLGLDYRSEGQFPGSEARSMEGMVDPVYEFLPTHAPSGLALITGDTFPAWEGNLLAGGLRSERIRRLLIYDNEVIHDEELLLGEIGRIRDVRQGPDGNIYVLNDREDGALFRITRD